MHRNLTYKTAVIIFILPALLLYTLVVCFPITQVIYRSFFEWDGIGIAKFTIFQNYVDLWSDSDFFLSIKNGLIFGLFITLYEIGLGFLLALLAFNKTTKVKKFFRTAYFIPVVLSVTVVCQLWVAIYADAGLLNKLFEALYLDYRQSWMGDTKVSILAVSFVNAWQNMGYFFILMYTSLKSIPEHYFEAAKIDGASSTRMHRVITIPLLSETFRFCLIMSVTGGLKAFAEMQIISNGGPGTSTYTLTMLMFRAAFQKSEYGYACAVAVVLVVECILFMLLINRFVSKNRLEY